MENEENVRKYIEELRQVSDGDNWLKKQEAASNIVSS